MNVQLYYIFSFKLSTQQYIDQALMTKLCFRMMKSFITRLKLVHR